MLLRLFVFSVFALEAGASASASAADKEPAPLRRFEQDGKFGYKDSAGKVVIEPSFDAAEEFAGGLAAVNRGAELDFRANPPRRGGGKWGYIDARGEVVVPLTFDWAQEFSEGLAQVSDQGGRRFIDKTGRTVVTLGNNVSFAGEFREGLAPVYPLGRKGPGTRFIDQQGKTVLEVEGHAQEFSEGLAVLSVPDPDNAQVSKYGYIDKTGKAVIAPQFAEALDFSEGLAAVRTKKTTVYGKGDTWGYIDKTGKFVLAATFNETHPFRKGVARVHVGGKLEWFGTHFPPHWEGGEWQLINREGEILKRSAEWVEYE